MVLCFKTVASFLLFSCFKISGISQNSKILHFQNISFAFNFGFNAINALILGGFI